MNVLSLFSGIGGMDRGLEAAGHHVVGQVELDPFCARVLAARWEHTPRWDDVRTFRFDGHEVDLLVGGFPCQDLSVAGRRAGLGGSRSALFWEYIRIAHETQAPWGLVENVPGLLSSHGGRDFWTLLQGLRQCWPAVGWRVLDSQFFGVPQRRRRVFVVGGPSDAGVAEVLALAEGGSGDSAPGGRAGTDVADALADGTGRRSGSGRDSQDTSVAATLNSGGNNGGFRTEPGEHLVIPIQYVEQWGRDKRQNGLGLGEAGDPSYTLDTIYPHGFMHSPNIVRRLTPLECERLQGFPDGWTCLCQPLAAYQDDPDAAARRCRCSDAPRYRALGNAVTVPVLAWLGRRLRAVEISLDTPAPHVASCQP